MLVSNVYSQTALPYFTGFDNSAQQSGWQIIRKGVISTYNWNYSSFNSYSAPNTLAHFYPVDGTAYTDDWFVSPEFSFPDGGKIDSIRHHFSGFGAPVTGDTIAVYLLTGSPDPAQASSKIILFNYVANYVNDNTWHLDTNIEIPATAGSSYIAFRYKTIISWLDVLFDNVAVSGVSSGIAENNDPFDKIAIFPNPANHILTVSGNISASATISIIDINGKVTRSVSPSGLNGRDIIDISGLNKGLYFLKISTGNTFTIRKFILE